MGKFVFLVRFLGYKLRPGGLGGRSTAASGRFHGLERWPSEVADVMLKNSHIEKPPFNVNSMEDLPFSRKAEGSHCQNGARNCLGLALRMRRTSCFDWRPTPHFMILWFNAVFCSKALDDPSGPMMGKSWSRPAGVIFPLDTLQTRSWAIQHRFLVWGKHVEHGEHV